MPKTSDKDQFNLVLFGVPNGFDSSVKGNVDLTNFLQQFYNTRKVGTQFGSIRKQNAMHYLYLVYPKQNSTFASCDGREGSFFGMDLILKNKRITNEQFLAKIFQDMYNKYIKSTIIQEFSDGHFKYKVKHFDNHEIITRIGTNMAQKMNEHKPPLTTENLNSPVNQAPILKPSYDR